MSLTRLTIKNIVLIEQLTINFNGGLGALTGETGAGKSILLDSLGLALGARSESRLVRAGADKASVTAEFDIAPNHPVFAAITSIDLDIDLEAGEPLILRRSLNADGRSRASLNDQPISAKSLQQIGAHLVEIHGQYDTHGLLDAGTHCGLLDNFAGLKAPLAPVWQAYKTAQKALKDAQKAAEQASSDEDYLRSAIQTLDVLAPEEGEEESLAILRDQLKHRQRVLEGLSAAYQALSTDQHDPIGTASGALSRIADKLTDADHDALFAALDRAQDAIEETRSHIQTLSDSLSESEHNLETIDERLYDLRREARKHNCLVDQLPAKREEMAQQLNLIERADDTLTELTIKAQNARAAFEKEAQHISQQRQNAAQKMDTAIMAELEPLKLGKATFKTNITPLPDSEWSAQGIDKVEFMVSTNPGQPLGSLGKIASGGEMSRFMLALKVVMAANAPPATLIFDEVDAGIGGGTADAVGQRLARLGANHQVLVVTHAPQVAAQAQHHFIVQKTVQDNQTHTQINALTTQQQREEEIARMLAGEVITPEALAAAKSLLQGAANTSQKSAA